MFGVSAKERLAQLQQKGNKDVPVGKLSAGLKPTPGKLNAGPGQLKKPEPPKSAADLKKPVAPQPVKPKEEPKKVEPVKPKEEPKAPTVQEPAKPKEELKTPVAPESSKPKEEPQKPAAPQQATPKEEPKTPTVPEPTKPKEEPKKPSALEPAKPKEEPKTPAVPEPTKPKEEPKKPGAPEPAKPKEEPKKPEASEPAKPKEEPKRLTEPAKPNEATKRLTEKTKPKEEPKRLTEPAKPIEEPKRLTEPAKPKEETKKLTEPAKPKEESKKPAAPESVKLLSTAPVKPSGETVAAKPVEEPKKPSDEFFHGIFYFSGMGTLVGSALAEGVYVPEKTQRNALDSDEIESARERQKLRRGEEIIVTARNQAQGLSTDFRHLQALLESLPTFTEALEPQPLERRAVDQVIHGHVYFQQEHHQAPTHSRPAHHHLTSSTTAEISSHAPLQQSTHVVTEARRVPVGGVPVMPNLFDQRHRQAADQHKDAASFAAAIDEFDRATSASQLQQQQQQPVFAALPPRPPSEPSRPHSRPTTEEDHGGEGHGDGTTRPIGVHTGHVVPPTQPWQERYGQTEVAKFAAPRPFSSTGGEIESKGIKPWQMSHLRTLEVKGYHIVSDTEPDAIKSYAPYLVSDRSQGADRQLSSFQHQHRVGGSSPHPTPGIEPPVAATSYKPPDAVNAPFAQSLEASVGYSDL